MESVEAPDFVRHGKALEGISTYQAPATGTQCPGRHQVHLHPCSCSHTALEGSERHSSGRDVVAVVICGPGTSKY